MYGCNTFEPVTIVDPIPLLFWLIIAESGVNVALLVGEAVVVSGFNASIILGMYGANIWRKHVILRVSVRGMYIFYWIKFIKVLAGV